MDKGRRRLVAALAAAGLVAACGGADGEWDEDDLAQPPTGTPGRVLQYGSVVYLKADASQWYLGLGWSWGYLLGAQQSPGPATEWRVISARDSRATGPVAYGDPLYLMHAGARLLLASSGSRFHRELELAGWRGDHATWTLEGPDGATSGAVMLHDPVRIRSAAQDCLWGPPPARPGRPPAIGLQDAAGASPELVWRIAPQGSHRHSDWMAEIAASLRDRPLTDAILPGSHDAGTYSIRDNSPIAPDLPVDDALRSLLLASPLLSDKVIPYIARFARAQGMDIASQLQAGVRYFDLRPGAADNGRGEDLLVVHSLYGGPVLPMVDAVAAFLAEHPREVVILDFSHFTAMGPGHHARLVAHLKQAFGTMLAPRPPGASEADPAGNAYTFGRLWEQGWQVVALYHDEAAAGEPLLWRYGTPENSSYWWPELPDPARVRDFLADRLARDRPLLAPGTFHVLQTVLTGDAALYQKVVLKLEATVLLERGRAALAPLQKFVNDAQREVNRLDSGIAGKKSTISDKEDWIEDNWWNLLGIAKREAEILVLRGEIAALQALLPAARSGLSAAQRKLKEASDALSGLIRQVNDPTVPTSLAELAAMGNPEMLGWLDAWRDRRLNIVIRDFADDAFVDKVKALNQLA